jgi:hypothetical protein
VVAAVSLETPSKASELYLAVTDEELEAFANRPVFTGDVLRLKSGQLVTLVQHPCAMRRGMALSPRLLVCGTKPFIQIPDDWSKGHFKRMFLPDMGARTLSIEFDDLDVVTRDDILEADRIAILSELGVNLLVQRWLHHNSRVIVPTITIHAQTTGPFEEADLVGEATDDLVEGGLSHEDAIRDVDEWLGLQQVESGPPRREMLNDPQSRGTIRSALRRHVRESAQ